MPSTKQIRKKKSHIKTSKAKRKPSNHSKKHLKSQKKKKSIRVDNSICLDCKGSSHTVLKCPKIWRTYILRKDLNENDKLILPIHTIYCYRCGEKGHLGDDCIKNETSKTMALEQSAFSGKNLEAPLSKIYYKTIKRQREDSDTFEDYLCAGNPQVLWPLVWEIGGLLVYVIYLIKPYELAMDVFH